MQHTHKPGNNIENLYNEYSVNELYGNDALASYLKVKQFDIQSTFTTTTGKQMRYSHKQISKIWDTILSALIKEKKMNLAGMLTTYHKDATSDLKMTIIKNIRDAAMRHSYRGEEVNKETIVLGLGMMFEDDLNWDNVDSIVHIIGHNVEEVLSSVSVEKKLYEEVKTA